MSNSAASNHHVNLSGSAGAKPHEVIAFDAYKKSFPSKNNAIIKDN